MGYDREEERIERMSKLRPKLAHDWEDLDKLSAKELAEKIVECEANLVENDREKKLDRKLSAAKDKVNELNAPYKEAKTRLTFMMEYCTLRLEELGKR